MNWEIIKNKLTQFYEKMPIEVALILGQCIFIIFLGVLIILVDNLK